MKRVYSRLKSTTMAPVLYRPVYILNDMDSPFLSTIPTVVVEGSTTEGSSHEQSRKSGN